MVRRGNLAVFEGSSNSETGKVTPTKIGVHACYINPYLYEFFEPIPIALNFLMTMDYRAFVRKGNVAVFEGSSMSKTGRVTAIKIGCTCMLHQPLFA